MGVVAALKRAIGTLISRPVEAESASVDAGPQRVLIVDDDQHALDTAEALLVAAGYLPILMSNPQSALQIARAMRPSIIFLDILLPGFDGWDVLAALKADASTRQIPVVMMSMLGERDRALAAGAAATVTMPLDAGKLRAALAKVGTSAGAVTP